MPGEVIVSVGAGGHCVIPEGTLGHEVEGGRGQSEVKVTVVGAGGDGGEGQLEGPEHSEVKVTVIGGGLGDGQLEGPEHSPVRLWKSQQPALDTQCRRHADRGRGCWVVPGSITRAVVDLGR